MLPLALSNELSLHLSAIQTSLRALSALPLPEQNTAILSYGQLINGQAALDSFASPPPGVDQLARITQEIREKCPLYGYRLAPVIDPEGAQGLGLFCFDCHAAATLATGAALLLKNAVVSNVVGMDPPDIEHDAFVMDLGGLIAPREKKTLRSYWETTGGYALPSEDGHLYMVVPLDWAQENFFSEFYGMLSHVVEIQEDENHPNLHLMTIELKKPFRLLSPDEMMVARRLDAFPGKRIVLAIDATRLEHSDWLFKQVKKGAYVNVIIEPKAP